MKKVLLYSGGMDSWLIDKIWKPDIKLYVDMKTRYSEFEIEKLPEDVIVEELDLGRFERDDSIIPLRNVYLVMLATNYGDEICLGATKGDRVLDKSKEFKNKLTDLLNYLYSPQWWIPEGREIKINLDYKDFTKEQLLNIYLNQGGNLKEAFEGSFSCYNPNNDDGQECWQCKPCFRKFVSFAKAGMEFSNKIKDKVVPYMKENIIPLIMKNVYNRGPEEEQLILDIYNSYFE